MTSQRNGKFVFWYISAAAWFALFGYGFARSAMTSQFNVTYGVQQLPLAMSLIVVAVFATVYVYGKILTRFGAAKTLVITSIGSAVFLALPMMFFQSGFKPAIWFLYLIKDAYIVLLIEQLWSCISSSFSKATAKRVGGPILGISTLGSIFAGLLVYKFTKLLGTNVMTWAAPISCLFTAYFGHQAYRYASIRQEAEDSQNPEFENHEKNKTSDPMGLRLFHGRKGLQYILAIVMVSQIYSAVVSIYLQTMLHEKLPLADEQTSWSGGFFAAVNTFSLVFQFVITPVLLKFFPIWIFFIVIPLVNLSFSIFALLRDDLFAVGSCFFFFKVLDYSLFKITKEVCYIPYDYDVRYRAKQVIDVIGYRFGKSLTPTLFAALPLVGIPLTPALYGGIAVATSVMWCVVGVPTGLTQRKNVDGES